MKTNLNTHIIQIVDAAQTLLSGTAGTLSDKQIHYTRSILASAEKFIHRYAEFQSAPLEQISSHMRHDLGNPLTPIQGYSELLMLGLIGSLNKQQQTEVEIIVDNTKALHEMVDKIVEEARHAALATAS